MLVGRIIFGLGGENQTVAQNALVAEWFQVCRRRRRRRRRRRGGDEGGGRWDTCALCIS